MAKLSANKSFELARLQRLNFLYSLRSDGRVLERDMRRQGWSLIERFSAAKGEARLAVLVDFARMLQANGAHILDSSLEFKRMPAAPYFAEQLLKGQQAVQRATSKRAEAELAAALQAEAERPQREQEQREREQFAQAALDARQAAARAITCSCCDNILDQSKTVLYRESGTSRLFAAHGSCFDGMRIRRDFVIEADGRTVPAHVWRCSTESLVGYAIVANRAARGAR